MSKTAEVTVKTVAGLMVSGAKKVLAEADVLMVCVHLDKNTLNMVDSNWFDLMKDGVYFINTSRGEIVNEDALIGAFYFCNFQFLNFLFFGVFNMRFAVFCYFKIFCA